MKSFDELREAYRKPTQAEIDADRRKDGKSKDTSSRYKNMKKKVYGNMMGGLKKEENDLDEAVSKVKTTMPDKVASSATRFGLKSKSQGGSVSISGPKGKLNDFLRAIIGRSSYGNASELDEVKLSDMEIHNKLANRNLLIKAIKTAEKMGGNMTGAVREIEKMKKGLSKHKAVQAALRQANESVDQTDEILEESVELSESPDLMKMSKELLKHKDKGIDYEKAAAYVRAIHNNSAVSVQDKAMKGLLTLLKNMDLTDRTTITKILKDNGFKTKGGRLMREGVESLDEALQSVTKIKFDYKDTMPKDPKPSDVGGLKQDWTNDRTAVRSAVKPLGGLVTDSASPS